MPKAGARTRTEIAVPAGVRLVCDIGGRRYAVAVVRDPTPPHDDVILVGSLGPARKRAARRRKAGLGGTLFAGVKEPASGVESLPPPILVLAPPSRADLAWDLANRLGRLGYHAETRTDEGEGGYAACEEGEEGEEAEEAEEAEAEGDRGEDDAAVHDGGLP